MQYSLKDVNVIHEDNHLLAINKPVGLLSQGDATGDPTALDLGKLYIKMRYDKPGAVFLGSFHRLDRPVSGVLVMARTSKALTRMNKLFQSRKVKKTYLALTRKKPDGESGKLKHFLLKDKEKNVTKAYDQVGRRTAAAKESKLEWKLLAMIDHYYLLEINPLTGRSHQIRAQLAAVGCPIVGDMKYGSRQKVDDRSIGLHCRMMEFVHPTTKKNIKIEAGMPQTELWKRFRNNF